MNGELAAESTQNPRKTLNITQSRALSYAVPRRSGRSSKNYVVQLSALTPNGEEVIGYGEGHPRWNRTGDDAGSSWKFLVDVVQSLQNTALDFGCRETALDQVREILRQAEQTAVQRSVDEQPVKPFRGTLAGIEAALLDLNAKALGLTLTEFLGKQRDAVKYVPESPISFDDPLLSSKVAAAEESGVLAVHLRGSDERARADEVLRSVLRADLEHHGDRERTIWLKAGTALGGDSVLTLADRVISAFQGQTCSQTVLLAEPFASQTGKKTSEVQQSIDQKLVDHPSLDLRVVADASVWDAADVDGLVEGIKAVNIRPAQAGGLLAAADTVRAITDVRPEVTICLSSMGDESRIAASAEHQLALALNKIDVVLAGATVEHILPLTEVGGETRDADSDPLVNQERLRQEASLSENPEETDSDDDGEDDEEGSSYLDDIPEFRPGFDVGEIERRSVPGIGVGVSFISLVNDVEKMETFPEPPLPEFEGMSPNTFTDIEDLHPLGARGSKGHLAEREALAMGLSTTRYSKGVFLASDGVTEPVNFKWNRHPLVSAVALGLCTHKEATRLQLQRAGVPVPQGRTFERGDLDNARAFAKRIGFPVVLKPAMGVRGIGVVANIQNEDELNDAYQMMTDSRLGDQDFIVEKHINGKDYRIVVVGNQVVAAIMREPASVVGDGVHSVAELLLNRNSARRRNPHLWARPPQYNAAAKYELQKAGLTINSVPTPGQVVRLGSTNSLSQGGESIAVLEELHPSIVEACVKIVRSVPGMDYCGVDFLLEDHTKPLDEQDAGVCELNAHAAIGNCQYPMFGIPKPVARIVMYEVARRFGLEVSLEPAESVALRVVVRGKLASSGFPRWLRRRAIEAGVDGWVRNLDEKRVEAVLVGPTNATTGIVSSLINGPRRARPTSYVAEHIEPPLVTGFEIRPDRAGMERLRVKLGTRLRGLRRKIYAR